MNPALASLCFLAGAVLFGIAFRLHQWRKDIEWRYVPRRVSSVLAVFNAAIVTHLATSAGALTAFIPFLDPKYRTVAAILVFLIWAIVPPVLANIRQPAIDESREKHHARTSSK